MSVLTLYNLVTHNHDAHSERLNRFGENRDIGAVSGKGGGGHHSDEDAPHSQNTEEGARKSDGKNKEDQSQEGNPPNKGKARHTKPRHKSSAHCQHTHSASWGSECESEGTEESERASTQEGDTVEERFPESVRSSASEGERSSEVDEDAGEESSEMLPLTSQESEEPLASVYAGAELITMVTGYGAWEELKPAGDIGTEEWKWP